MRSYVLEEFRLALESGQFIDLADDAEMVASRAVIPSPVIPTLLERDILDQSAAARYAPEPSLLLFARIDPEAI